MKVTTEITDTGLSELTDDELPDEPHGLVHATIGDSSGMRWNGAVLRYGASQMTPEQYAEALVSAVHGAARLHSPDTARALEAWLVVPPTLEVE